MQKTVKDLTDIELATSLRDHLIEQSRINANIQLLNQELEDRRNKPIENTETVPDTTEEEKAS